MSCLSGRCWVLDVFPQVVDHAVMKILTFQVRGLHQMPSVVLSCVLSQFAETRSIKLMLHFETLGFHIEANIQREKLRQWRYMSL